MKLNVTRTKHQGSSLLFMHELVVLYGALQVKGMATMHDMIWFLGNLRVFGYAAHFPKARPCIFRFNLSRHIQLARWWRRCYVGSIPYFVPYVDGSLQPRSTLLDLRSNMLVSFKDSALCLRVMQRAP
jgi:hypothetical protein